MTRTTLPILLTLTLLSACDHATLRTQPDAAADGPAALGEDTSPPAVDGPAVDAMAALDTGVDVQAVDTTPAVDIGEALDSGAETASAPCCVHWEMGAGSFSVPGCWQCGNVLRCVGTQCQAATSLALCQPQPVEAWTRAKPDCD